MKFSKEILCAIQFDDIAVDSGIELIEKGDWIDDNKYSCKSVVFKFHDKFYQYHFSRSGSYYTDYYYSTENLGEDGDEAKEVIAQPITVMKWVLVR